MNTLYLLSTPIGNIKDISKRAIEHLTETSHFLCEDTRQFRKLMAELSIPCAGKQIEAFHGQSPDYMAKKIMNQIRKGQDWTYLSDAGSPVISDPAYPLLKLARDHEVRVVSLPGPCSVIHALELSCLPVTPFTFLGFIPRTGAKRKAIIDKIKVEESSFVIFESPLRVRSLVQELSENIAKGRISVIREMTKMYEETVFFDLGNDIDLERIKEKGEFVVVVRPESISSSDSAKASYGGLGPLALEYLEKPRPRVLAKILSGLTGKDSKEVFEALGGFSK